MSEKINQNETMRINRYLSLCGIASRRKADELIQQKRISVNGIIIDKPGYIVNMEKDKILFDGKIIKHKLPVHYKFYKPVGIITTAKDERNRNTVMDFFSDDVPGLFPVGRLDKESEGLIIVTNDGELANRLTHPSFGVEKIYEVIIDRVLTSEEIARLEKGVRLEEGVTARCKIEITGKTKNGMELLFIIHQGWNRQIRRMLQTTGTNVKALRRIFIGPISVQGLKPGEKKKLSSGELNTLKSFVKL